MSFHARFVEHSTAILKKKKDYLKKVIFANRKILLLARIYFRELASSKYFAEINFRE